MTLRAIKTTSTRCHPYCECYKIVEISNNGEIDKEHFCLNHWSERNFYGQLCPSEKCPMHSEIIQEDIENGDLK